MKAAGLGSQQDSREDLHARAGRHRTCDHTQLLRQLVALANDLYPRPYHGVGFNHLNLVVVIGVWTSWTRPRSPLVEPFSQGMQMVERSIVSTGTDPQRTCFTRAVSSCTRL